jgi:hypothetical protein
MPGTPTLIRFTGFVKTDFFRDTRFTGSTIRAFSGFGTAAWCHPVFHQLRAQFTEFYGLNSPSRFTAEFRQPLVKGFVDWDSLWNAGMDYHSAAILLGTVQEFSCGASAFGDPDAFPDTLDFAGPPGMGNRKPQFPTSIR